MKTIEILNQIKTKPLPNHIAIILDGNGRWATKRNLPRTLGHQKGIDTLGKLVTASKQLGIKNLTVFVFSTENINRPKDEVKFLFNRFLEFYRTKYNKLKENNNVQIIGELTNLPQEVISVISDINSQPFNHDCFTFTLAFNYGSKQEMVHATKEVAKLVKNNKIKIVDINEDVIEKHLYTNNLLPLDLVIRTSGEYRLSNFLLWQASYAELYFTNTYFPDFKEKELYEAILNYQLRHRRFGKLGEQVG